MRKLLRRWKVLERPEWALFNREEASAIVGGVA